MELSLEQKREIERIFLECPDLIQITRRVFGDNTLKGSSKEGKAVRDHLLEKGLRYKTTKHKKVKPIVLTDGEKEFVKQKADEGLSSYAIASLLFPDKNIRKLGMEQRAVMDHIRTLNPDFGAPKEGAISSYSPPNAVSRIVKRINDATGLSLEEDKLSRQQLICVQKLGINLSNSRFVIIMNNYVAQEHRDLFEQEFVRLTWDKPDLTADEINLYINVCKEIIHMEIVSKHLNKLNKEFDLLEDQGEMSVRLTELIKAKSDEYHKCEGRIESLTKKLQGDRAERMKKKREQNASILSIVQLWQDEQERRNMVRIAEIQKEAIRAEADRIENMDMLMARILGADRDDLI